MLDFSTGVEFYALKLNNNAMAGKDDLGAIHTIWALKNKQQVQKLIITKMVQLQTILNAEESIFIKQALIGNCSSRCTNCR